MIRHTMRFGALFIASFLVGATSNATGQALRPSAAGPIIERFGAVYPVDDVDYGTPTDRAYRVVFDVSSGSEDPSQLNARINTLARFLNMHAQAGVPAANMQLALVLHGSAGKDALDNAGFRNRFGIDNPNLPLLHALSDAGVKIFLCGQTAAHRGLAKDELAPQVQLALSAMTVLVTLQSEGYELVAF